MGPLASLLYTERRNRRRRARRDDTFSIQRATYLGCRDGRRRSPSLTMLAGLAGPQNLTQWPGQPAYGFRSPIRRIIMDDGFGLACWGLEIDNFEEVPPEVVCVQ